jgi:hypothetical protein
MNEIKKIVIEWEKDFKVMSWRIPFDRFDLKSVRKYAKRNLTGALLKEIQEEARILLNKTENMTQEEFEKIMKS